MIADARLFLGFDPGGKGKFGVALMADSTVSTSTVDSVVEAFEWAKEKCGFHQPSAAGIDTLLHWNDGPSGWRPADRWLIRNHRASAKSVVSPNGLYGAMAIGGMGLALRLRHHWPDIALNETHPKVLVPALGGQRYSDSQSSETVAWFRDYSGLDIGVSTNGHELNALLSAWVTKCGIDEQWQDIIGDDGSLLRPAGCVTYFWPPALSMNETMSIGNRE